MICYWQSAMDETLERVAQLHDRRADACGFLDQHACMLAAIDVARYGDLDVGRDLAHDAEAMGTLARVTVGDVVARVRARLLPIAASVPLSHMEQVTR